MTGKYVVKIRLLSVRSRFVYKAGVQELSKEEFEQFNVS